jgi:hypothetical protein
MIRRLLGVPVVVSVTADCGELCRQRRQLTNRVSGCDLSANAIPVGTAVLAGKWLKTEREIS